MKLEDEYSPEKLAALRTVRKLVEFWQIRPHELRGPVPPAPAPPPAGPATIRYRHPVTGETWDGQGEHPQWLRDALLKEGYTVDALKRAVGEAGAGAEPGVLPAPAPGAADPESEGHGPDDDPEG